jgi:hypothetical protein
MLSLGVFYSIFINFIARQKQRIFNRFQHAGWSPHRETATLPAGFTRAAADTGRIITND